MDVERLIAIGLKYGVPLVVEIVKALPDGHGVNVAAVIQEVKERLRAQQAPPPPPSPEPEPEPEVAEAVSDEDAIG